MTKSCAEVEATLQSSSPHLTCVPLGIGTISSLKGESLISTVLSCSPSWPLATFRITESIGTVDFGVVVPLARINSVNAPLNLNSSPDA